jgi:muramoyltetrapeptide carboxypeptidase
MPALDFDSLRKAPKWLVGFSDWTALHLEAQRLGIMTLHAHNVAGLGRADAHARAEWCSALEQPELPQRFENLTVYQAGDACGRLWGGNLTVLFTCHASGQLALPRGSVLVLEDVAETSYRIDRMLTALLQARVLDHVSAILLGEFSDCSAGKYAVPTHEVLAERLCQLGVPILADLPLGHGRRNLPLLLGANARVEGAAGRLLVNSNPDPA